MKLSSLRNTLVGLSLLALPWTGFAESEPQVDAPEPALKIAAKTLNQSLIQDIDTYMKVWKARDYDKLHQLENWESGAPLDKVDYIGTFNTRFHIMEWRVTQTTALEEEGLFKALVLVTHNPPQEVMQYLPKGKTVNSTLIQWWKKNEKGGFEHLYHVEKKNLAKLLTPPSNTENVDIPEELKNATLNHGHGASEKHDSENTHKNDQAHEEEKEDADHHDHE